jgi:hypothetical protein
MDAWHWDKARLQWHFFFENLLEGEKVIALNQEPCFYGDQIWGLRNTKEKPFSAGPSIVPRLCIFIRSTVHAFLLSKLCSRDMMTVKMIYIRGSKRELTLTSAYFP